MKTEQELNELKKEVEELKQKLSSLTEEEIEQICGGGVNEHDEQMINSSIPQEHNLMV